MLFARAVVVTLTDVLAVGACTSRVPAVNVSVPRVSCVLLPPFGVKMMDPPAVFRTKLPNVWVIVSPLRPLNSKSPPAMVSGVAARKPLVSVLAEASRVILPPEMVVTPV